MFFGFFVFRQNTDKAQTLNMLTFEHMKTLSPALFLILIFLLASCSKDDEIVSGITCDGSNLGYNSGISAIINSNCNSSNCHNSGSVHGDFTTYTGMSVVLRNGSFNNRVLVVQNMPQGSATLTKSQLNKLKCWVDNGFPEN